MTVDKSVIATISPLLLLLLGLVFTVVIDPYIKREHRRTMLGIAIVIVIIVIAAKKKK